jgi:electron transfer flavoprotein beta subunit
MKALVAVKRVVDYAVKVRVLNNAGVDLNVKMSMNPFCEIALEESIRLREKGLLSEVVAVSIGPTQCQETLRQALAMGADKAILIKSDEMRTDSDLQPLGVAKVLSKLVEREKPLLVMMGKQSIDGDNNQTGQLLAGLLSWPQATFASAVTFNELKSAITVDREVDSGIQKVSMNLPAVVTTDLRLNTPRFATLPNLMKAKKKPLEVIELSSLGVDVAPRVKYVKLEEPPVRKGGRIMGSVDELVNALRNEAKVV